MENLYSLYDALLSINVPAEKARAVVNAMERDMLSKLATKTDLQLMRAEMQTALARQTVSLLLGAGSLSVAVIGALYTLLKLT